MYTSTFVDVLVVSCFIALVYVIRSDVKACINVYNNLKDDEDEDDDSKNLSYFS